MCSSSVITPELIFTSHQFLDSSHYLQIFNGFKENVQKDQELIGSSLSTCKTPEERIKLFAKYFQWAQVPPKYFQRLQKNPDFSTSFRHLGNDYYKKRLISEALRCYNLALQFAPKDGNLRGLAFANRSALFYSVGLDPESLLDCERALGLEISDPGIRDKLEKRMTNIGKLTFSKTKSQGQVFLEESLKNVKNNPEIKFANSFLSIKVDEVKGRSLANNGDSVIPPGRIILADPGYLIIVDKQIKFDTEHCSNCGICVLNGIPSDEDVFSYYCSTKCYNEFQEMYPNLPKLYEYFHFTEELQDCLLIAKLFLKHGSGHNNFQDLQPSPVYDSTEYKSVFNLIAHYDKVDVGDLKPIFPIFKAIFLAHLLQEFVPSLDIETIANLAYRHLNNLKYNMITLSEWRSTEGPITLKFWEDRAKSNYLQIKAGSYATGLFSLVALCNHSCSPNCVFIKNPGVKAGYLMSVREVEAGEEFTICYNQPWDRLGFEERQHYLWTEYRFLCQCWACEGGLGPNDIVKCGGGRSEGCLATEPTMQQQQQRFKTLLKNGDDFLKRKQVFEAMRAFLEMGVVAQEEKWGGREEGVVLWQEFGRRLGVEIGMW